MIDRVRTDTAAAAYQLPGHEAKETLKEYSEVLIRNIEDKSIQVEAMSRALRKKLPSMGSCPRG